MFAHFVPLFLPSDYSSRLRRLKREHSTALASLLQPLERLSTAEREAVSAACTAQTAAEAWEANEAALEALLPPTVLRTLALPAPGDGASAMPPSEDHTTDTSTYETAHQLLAHLARDWSAEGAEARRKTHGPVLRALRREQRRRRSSSGGGGALRVLVPGAGLCRLAWEVARRVRRCAARIAAHRRTPCSGPHLRPVTMQGHRVEASDASVGMVVAAHSILTSRWAGAAQAHRPRLLRTCRRPTTPLDPLFSLALLSPAAVHAPAGTLFLLRLRLLRLLRLRLLRRRRRRRRAAAALLPACALRSGRAAPRAVPRAVRGARRRRPPGSGRRSHEPHAARGQL